ncbi:MAG: hypothetical protein E6Q97_03105 [Desulfurellales bacterium]|nr:MAG: hypothetical protein E6Q97_03105 [Desulfurellales bacterium]
MAKIPYASVVKKIAIKSGANLVPMVRDEMISIANHAVRLLNGIAWKRSPNLFSISIHMTTPPATVTLLHFMLIKTVAVIMGASAKAMNAMSPLSLFMSTKDTFFFSGFGDHSLIWGAHGV